MDIPASFVNALLISAGVAFAAAFVYLFVVKEVAPAPLPHAATTQPT